MGNCLLVLVASFVMLAPRLADAQICAGIPRTHVGVPLAFSDGGHSIGFRFAVGERSAFGFFGYDIGFTDGTDDKSNSYQWGAGLDKAIGRQERVFVCPFVNGSSQGPNNDLMALSVGGGGSVRVVVLRRDAVTIVPALSVQGVFSHISSSAPFSRALNETAGILGAGVGLMFLRGHIGLKPSVAFPFANDANDLVLLRTFRLYLFVAP